MSVSLSLDFCSFVSSAKFDATENDVPSQYQVRGFPTLFFVPKNEKSNPRKYEVMRRDRLSSVLSRMICDVLPEWP